MYSVSTNLFSRKYIGTVIVSSQFSGRSYLKINNTAKSINVDTHKPKMPQPSAKSTMEMTKLRWSNTSNKLLQLATQHYCAASWKTLLHVLPTTSNIVTQQNLVVPSWSSMLQQVEHLNCRLLFSKKNFNWQVFLRDNVLSG